MPPTPNRLLTGDNLHFLRRLDSDSVDLIYLDPPFNTKRTFAAPIGSEAAGASFKDMWSWSDVDMHSLEALYNTHPRLVGFIESISGIHGKPMMAYCLYMAQRIIEMHRVLKSTGSLYLHCDPTASHYLKLILDEIFGEKRFMNEVAWSYQTGGASKRWFSRKHDVLLVYTKGDDYLFNHKSVQVSRTEKSIARAQNPAGARISADDTTKVATDVWTDIQALNPMSVERTGYPTQKPLALLHRIIKASSNEGDVVLDPFCGCATTCVAAQQLKRRWIGIDIEENAANLLVKRLSDDAGMFSDFDHIKDPELLTRSDITPTAQDKTAKGSLFAKQKGICNGCGVKFLERNLTIDHILPKSRGGSDVIENYQLLCQSCNSIKGNRPMEFLRQRIAQIKKILEQEITYDR